MKIKSIIIAGLVVVVASCGSSKKASEQTPEEILKPAATEQTIPQNDNTPDVQQPTPVTTVSQFISDLDLSVAYGEEQYDLGGKVSMKRGKVVRMNLTFMGFIEVGIIEFTPDYILIVNRMGKEFTKASYNSIDALGRNNITFSTIEEMAWEKLYPKEGRKLRNTDLDSAIGNLINANVKGKNKVTVRMEIGKPNTTRDFETYTSVKSSYKEVPVNILMTQLMKFGQ